MELIFKMMKFENNIPNETEPKNIVTFGNVDDIFFLIIADSIAELTLNN